MNKLICHFCELEFQTDCLLDNFCSNKCSINYWKNPIRLNIVSECPQCNKQYNRTIFSVDFRNYQSNVLCKDCGEITYVGNTVTW